MNNNDKTEKACPAFYRRTQFSKCFWCWIFAWWGESAYLNHSNFSVTSKLEFRFFFGHCSTIQKSLLCPVFRSLSSFTVFRDAGFFAQKDILKVKLTVDNFLTIGFATLLRQMDWLIYLIETKYLYNRCCASQSSAL